jgi:hypothetical protein
MPGGVHQFTNGAVRPQVGLDDRFLSLHRCINHGLIGNQAHIPDHCVKPQQSGDVIDVVGFGSLGFDREARGLGDEVLVKRLQLNPFGFAMRVPKLRPLRQPRG